MLRQQFSGIARIVRLSQAGINILRTIGTFLVGAALIAALPHSGRAGSKTWNGPNSANWSSSSYWSPTSVPVDGDDVTVSVDNPRTTDASLTMDATNLSGSGLNSFTLDSTGIGGTFTINQTGASSAMIATSEAIGSTVSGNVYSQSAGTNTVRTLTLGSIAGSYGTYQLSGTGILTASREYVGHSGGATFTQSGGTNNLGDLEIAYLTPTGSVCTYNLTGPGALVAINEFVGVNGAGYLNQSSGTNTLVGYLYIGLGTGGTYDLSGGSASVEGNVNVGNNGCAGVLTVSGSAVLTIYNTLTAYNTPGTVINLSGGRINTPQLDFNGLPSLFNWTGGTLNLTSDVTFDSAAVNSTSKAFGPSLTLGNNQTLMVTGNETLGGTGPFSLTLNNGSTHYVTGSITLNPTGTITQAGGTVYGTLQNQGTFIYQSGTFNGRLRNQGSVSLAPGVTFTAGNGIENDATMSLGHGQTINIYGSLFQIGLDNFGTFNLSGGVISGDSRSCSVVNEVGGLMSGYGTFNLPVFNLGAVTVDNGSTTFNGQFSGTGSIGNSGSLVFNTAANIYDTIGGTLTNYPSASLVVQGNRPPEIEAGLLEIDAAPTLGRASSIAVNGGSRLKFNVASGAATVGTGVTATVASGSTLELAGSVSALSSGANRVNIVNDSSALGLLVSGTHQQVGSIDGSGTTQVNTGSDLSANHIVQSALVIGGAAGSPALITIEASDSHGNPLRQSSDQTSALILEGSLDTTGAAAVGPPIAASFSTIGEPSSNDPSGPQSVLGSAGVGGSGLSVPEPATWLLVTIGSLAGLGHVFRLCRAAVPAAIRRREAGATIITTLPDRGNGGGCVTTTTRG